MEDDFGVKSVDSPAAQCGGLAAKANQRASMTGEERDQGYVGQGADLFRQMRPASHWQVKPFELSGVWICQENWQ